MKIYNCKKKIDYAKKNSRKKEEIKISKDKIKEFKKQGYTEDDSPIYNLREKIMHLEDSIGFQKDKIKKKDFSLNRVDFYNKYFPWNIGGNEFVKY